MLWACTEIPEDDELSAEQFWNDVKSWKSAASYAPLGAISPAKMIGDSVKRWRLTPQVLL
jgi:hypothetical protein